MDKKRQFHCEKCGNPCTIYKKGKKHRVLVCPECGVIATNPLPLIAAAAPLALKAVKGVGAAVGLSSKKSKTTDETSRTIIRDEKGKYEYKAKMFDEAMK